MRYICSNVDDEELNKGHVVRFLTEAAAKNVTNGGINIHNNILGI